jgi:hypothetical protein
MLIRNGFVPDKVALEHVAAKVERVSRISRSVEMSLRRILRLSLYCC